MPRVEFVLRPISKIFLIWWRHQISSCGDDAAEQNSCSIGRHSKHAFWNLSIKKRLDRCYITKKLTTIRQSNFCIFAGIRTHLFPYFYFEFGVYLDL